MADFQPTRAACSGSVDSMLAQLFRNIMYGRNITHAQFNYLILSYLSHTAHGVPQNIKKQSNDRGNLRKQLLKDTMTWRVFYKGLWFLRIQTCTITLMLTHPVHPPTRHQLPPIELKEHSRPGMLLAQLFQNVLLSLGIAPQALTAQLLRQAAAPRGALRAAEPLPRTNLKNELLKNSLSWKVFCKGLWALNVQKITLQVDLVGRDHRPSQHAITLIQAQSQIRRPPLPVLKSSTSVTPPSRARRASAYADQPLHPST